MLKDKADAFQGHVGVLLGHLHVANRAFNAVAESVDAAGRSHLCGGVDRELAIEYDMDDVEAYDNGRALDAAVAYDGTNGDFGTCAGGGRDRNDRECLAGNGKEFLQQSLDGKMGHLHAGGYHLAGVHH